MSLLRRQAPRLAACAVLGVLYGLAQVPDTGPLERRSMAERFAFTALRIETGGDAPQRRTRAVHPSLEHISAWISSVGASLALGDIDNDGVANDMCHVEVRTDTVSVMPAPATAPRFAAFEIGSAAGQGPSAPMGCLVGDLNEDGWPDLLVYYWGGAPMLFLRRGDREIGPDAYVAQATVPTETRWYTNAATLADLNGDGHVDMVFGNYFADDSHVLGAAEGRAVGAPRMHDSMSYARNGGSNRILLWSDAAGGPMPYVEFEDVSGVLTRGVADAWTLAVGAADLDGDLLPEVYFANDFGPDHLLHNRSRGGELAFAVLRGKRALGKPKSKTLGNDSFKGMGVDFADVDGDGLLDIYVSNITGPWSLQESHFVFRNTGDPDAMRKGVAPFVDDSERLGLARSGWAWDVKLADFDADGVLEAVQATGFVQGHVDRWPQLHELAMANDELLKHPNAWPHFVDGDDLSGHQYNAFFVRGRGGRYVDLARTLDLEPAGPFVSRGVAVADVDGDGDQDFAVANQWRGSVLYRNDSASPNAFLGVRLLVPVIGSGTGAPRVIAGLRSVPSTRPALGAAVAVALPGGDELVSFVDGGNGHSGARSANVFLGLGPRWGAELEMRISWRNAHGRRRDVALALPPGWHTIVLPG